MTKSSAALKSPHSSSKMITPSPKLKMSASVTNRQKKKRFIVSTGMEQTTITQAYPCASVKTCVGSILQLNSNVIMLTSQEVQNLDMTMMSSYLTKRTLTLRRLLKVLSTIV